MISSIMQECWDNLDNISYKSARAEVREISVLKSTMYSFL